jgi:hypothetical protein
MNTSKSLDSILTKFMNACCDYEGGVKVDLDKEFENTTAAIVEAVEELINQKVKLSVPPLWDKKDAEEFLAE